ncbi:hypothetical protein CEE58_15875 [Stenotrophomonas maltophilia]|nr:hypothetical protein CEE58_15875 [Stenotrophomonas maltophilia]
MELQAMTTTQPVTQRWADLSAHHARLIIERTEHRDQLVVESTDGTPLPPGLSSIGFRSAGNPGRAQRDDLALSLGEIRPIFPRLRVSHLPIEQLVRELEPLRELRDGLRKQFGAEVDVSKIRTAKPEAHVAIRARALAKLLDVEPVFVRNSGTDRRLSFAGAVTRTRGDKRVYVNADAEFPALAVVGHEALHQMRFQHPDLYQSLVECLKPAINQHAWKRYYAELVARSRSEDVAPMSDDAIREEAVADIVGDLLMDPKVWAEIDDRSVVTRLLEWLQELMANLVALFRQAGPRQEASLGGKELLHDLHSAQLSVAWALRSWRIRSDRGDLERDLGMAFRQANGPTGPSSETQQALSESVVRHADGSLRAVYRGQWGASTSPGELETRLPSIPFSVSPDVASVYAMESGSADALPRVSACYLDIRRPMELGTGDPVVSFEEFWSRLEPTNAVTKVQAQAAFAAVRDFVHEDASDEFESDEVVGDHWVAACHVVADCVECVELAKTAGFDGFVFNGMFTSDNLFVRPAELVTSGGYDFSEGAALEFRAFALGQVVPYFEASFDPGVDGAALKRAYHGSPHRFEQPSLSTANVGESGAAYGHGLYLADVPAVANVYRDKQTYLSHPVRFGNRLVAGRDVAGEADRQLGEGAGAEAQWALQLMSTGYRADDLVSMADGMEVHRAERVRLVLDRLQRFDPNDVKQLGVLLAHEGGQAAMDSAGALNAGYRVRQDMAWHLSQGADVNHARSRVLAEQSERAASLEVHLLQDRARLASAEGAGQDAIVQSLRVSIRDTRWFLREAHDAVRLLSDPGLLVADVRHLAGEGFLYAADIDDSAQLLEWDSTLSPEQVSSIAVHLDEAKARSLHAACNPTSLGFGSRGGDVYRSLQAIAGGAQAASEILERAGYAGLRYLDGKSRTEGEGTYNYVIWDLEAVRGFGPVGADRCRREDRLSYDEAEHVAAAAC